MNNLSNFSNFELNSSENVIGGRSSRRERRFSGSWGERDFSFDFSSWCNSEEVAAVAEELEQQVAALDTDAILAEVEALVADFGVNDIEV